MGRVVVSVDFAAVRGAPAAAARAAAAAARVLRWAAGAGAAGGGAQWACSLFDSDAAGGDWGAEASLRAACRAMGERADGCLARHDCLAPLARGDARSLCHVLGELGRGTGGPGEGGMGSGGRGKEITRAVCRALTLLDRGTRRVSMGGSDGGADAGRDHVFLLARAAAMGGGAEKGLASAAQALARNAQADFTFIDVAEASERDQTGWEGLASALAAAAPSRAALVPAEALLAANAPLAALLAAVRAETSRANHCERRVALQLLDADVPVGGPASEERAATPVEFRAQSEQSAQMLDGVEAFVVAARAPSEALSGVLGAATHKYTCSTLDAGGASSAAMDALVHSLISRDESALLVGKPRGCRLFGVLAPVTHVSMAFFLLETPAWDAATDLDHEPEAEKRVLDATHTPLAQALARAAERQGCRTPLFERDWGAGAHLEEMARASLAASIAGATATVADARPSGGERGTVTGSGGIGAELRAMMAEAVAAVGGAHEGGGGGQAIAVHAGAVDASAGGEALTSGGAALHAWWNQQDSVEDRYDQLVVARAERLEEMGGLTEATEALLEAAIAFQSQADARLPTAGAAVEGRLRTIPLALEKLARTPKELKANHDESRYGFGERAKANRRLEHQVQIVLRFATAAMAARAARELPPERRSQEGELGSDPLSKKWVADITRLIQPVEFLLEPVATGMHDFFETLRTRYSADLPRTFKRVYRKLGLDTDFGDAAEQTGAEDWTQTRAQAQPQAQARDDTGAGGAGALMAEVAGLAAKAEEEQPQQEHVLQEKRPVATDRQTKSRKRNSQGDPDTRATRRTKPRKAPLANIKPSAAPAATADRASHRGGLQARRGVNITVKKPATNAPAAPSRPGRGVRDAGARSQRLTSSRPRNRPLAAIQETPAMPLSKRGLADMAIPSTVPATCLQTLGGTAGDGARDDDAARPAPDAGALGASPYARPPRLSKNAGGASGRALAFDRAG